MRILVAITGASGVIYGKRFLEVCKELDIKTELIVSDTARKILSYEIGESKENLEKLATKCYDYNDLTSPPASGSYKIDAMVIIPCSMGKLAKIANGIADDLIARAADVCLKQRRPLVLVIRETPLNLVHLENMLKICKAGGIILPANPAFYHKPKDITSLVDFVIGKVLDVLNISHDLYKRWTGIP
ncbi:MAG: UbiX family flavin prenyltransferase [Candidatus Hadarchaeales archaeon]